MTCKVAAIAVIAIIIVSAFAGWHVRDLKAERDTAQLKAQQLEVVQQLTQQNAQQELKAQQEAQITSDEYQAEKERLNRRYRELYANFVRLQQQAGNDSAAGTNQAATATASTGACKPCAGQSHGAISVDTKRRAELLALARDCDVIATKLNALQRFYEALRRED